jgi:hypothetical protein
MHVEEMQAHSTLRKEQWMGQQLTNDNECVALFCKGCVVLKSFCSELWKETTV